MQHLTRSSVGLVRVLAIGVIVALMAWLDVSVAVAGIGSTPEETGRDACLNGAMYLDAIVEQEAAFMETTDRFVASQRAAYPKGLVLDGTDPQDEAAHAAWEDAFWNELMFSWVGVRAPGAPMPTGPNAGFQDSYNYTASQRQQWGDTRSPCRDNAPSACRRMVRTGDAAIVSIDAVYDAARNFMQGVGVRSQNAPGALYGRVPALLDALAESTRTTGEKAADRVATFRVAEKRCVKSLGVSWPLPTVPAPRGP